MISRKTYGVALIGNHANKEAIKAISRMIAAETTMIIHGHMHVDMEPQMINVSEEFKPFEYPDAMDTLMQLQKRQCEEAEMIIRFDDPNPDAGDNYYPKRPEDPKPKGFDHTKFSRRKRR